MSAWEILGLPEGTWDEETIRQAYQFWHAECERDREALARVEAAYQWLMTQLAAAGDLDEVFNDLEPDAGLGDFDLEAWLASGLASAKTEAAPQERQAWLQAKLDALATQINDWPAWHQLLVSQMEPETAVPDMDFWTGVAQLPLERIDQLRIIQALLATLPQAADDRPEGLYQRLVSCWTEVSAPYKGYFFWGTLAGFVSAIGTLLAMGLMIVNWLGLLIWPQAYPIWLFLGVAHLVADHLFSKQMTLASVKGLDAYFLESAGYRWYALASFPLAANYLATLVVGGLAVFWPSPWLGVFGWCAGIFLVLATGCWLAERRLGPIKVDGRLDSYDLNQALLMAVCAGLVLVTLVALVLGWRWPNVLMLGLAIAALRLIRESVSERAPGQSLLIQCLITLDVGAFLAAWRLYQGSLDLIPQILWVWMALSTVLYCVGCVWLSRRQQPRHKEVDQ